jgi:L-fuconolactonase
MIDAHQHFWKYDPINYAWIDESMKAIQKDFMPNDLAPVLEANGFEGSVLVQVNQMEAENEAFLKLADENDLIKGVVGWVDFKSESLETWLKHYTKTPKMKGFRHIVQGEPDDFLMDESFIRGVEKLKKYNFAYDILIYERQLKAALHFTRQLPENKLIIDHIAKPDIKNKSFNTWSNYMKEIAKHENVYVDFSIYLDHVLNCFGTKRIVYGSDWPVCLVAASYEDQLGIVKDHYGQLSKTEQDDIFGLNAIKFYNL